MTVPSITKLLYIGGPHDGLTRHEHDLPLELGDVLRCSCHQAVYEFKYRDEHGFDVVEYDSRGQSVAPSKLRAAVS